jgi:branched-chain amino acid aminotransferase
MADSIIYLNGAYLPEAEARVPVTERGFFGGDGVYEVTRTFAGDLFRLDAHLARLYRSLAYIRVDPGLGIEKMRAITTETLARNLERLGPGADFALWHLVARADSVHGNPEGLPAPPIISIFCVETDFGHYADPYLQGLRLVTPGVRRTPPDSIDAKAKVLSRMNQIQAALEASKSDPGAVPLMLDRDGNITETNTGNFFFVAGGKLMTADQRGVLGGVTRATILELAAELGIEAVEGDFTPYDVYAADEAFVTSTSPVILPVKSLNGAGIGGDAGNPGPGPVTLKLMRAFIDLAGLDFVAQALQQRTGNEAADGLAQWRAMQP